MNRKDIRRFVSENRFRLHLNNYGIRLLDTSLNTYVQTDLNNKLATANTYWNYLNFTMESGDFLRLAFEHSIDDLKQDFLLLNQLPIEQGKFTYQRNWVIFNSSKSRWWQLDVRWNNGEFYNGERLSQSYEFNMQPTVHFNLGLKIQTDDMKIAEQQLEITQYALKLDYIHSNKLSWQNYIQYDDLNKKLGLNSRLRWVYKPGFETNFSLMSNYLNPDEGSWKKQVEELYLTFSTMWLF